MDISAQDPNRRRIRRQNLDRASVAQFSVVGESEVPGMWTTGRLSKLTGIPARTLQEWSKKPKTSTRGKTSGSGILPATTNPGNGYRLFDEDSLYDILVIKLAKEAGLQDAQIRDITMPKTKGRPMADAYIERLLRKRCEIDRKIEIARTISFVERTKIFSLRADCETEDARGLEGLMASELVDCIAARIAESSRNEQAETDRLINDASWHAGVETLEMLWRSGESPRGGDAMRAVEMLHRSLDGIPYAISTEMFSAIATKWASKGYTRIVLALRNGEEFLAFFEQAALAYGA
ncbi:MerR family transcriptional regulator [Slackia piriformis]|uniref:HTH merR-type domain-containing protein n=1 Tax=Slackia piriformis YIT 12062 TaxID=742818 RepID=K0YIP9_9ACTN|nr:hypothetical protein [Slackia piriformis]EJZ83452.1 hypothetical protein HMPREF9451_00957 [Slackia piriformis YIT 12062]